MMAKNENLDRRPVRPTHLQPDIDGILRNLTVLKRHCLGLAGACDEMRRNISENPTVILSLTDKAEDP